jgi:DNA-binding transcriptional LysR family regulator
LGLYAARTYAQTHGLHPGTPNLAGAQIITWNDEYRHLGGRRWLAEHALGTRVSLAANSRLIQFVACKAGLGVGILPAFAADREPDLVCLLPPRKVLSTKLWLVVHHDLAQVVRVRAVMDFLAASAQSNPKLDARQFCPLWVDSVDKVADEEGLGSVLERLALTLPTDA